MCVACSYKSVAGEDPCEQCPADSYAAAGSSVCDSCPVYSSSAAGSHALCVDAALHARHTRGVRGWKMVK